MLIILHTRSVCQTWHIVWLCVSIARTAIPALYLSDELMKYSSMSLLGINCALIYVPMLLLHVVRNNSCTEQFYSITGILKGKYMLSKLQTMEHASLMSYVVRKKKKSQMRTDVFVLMKQFWSWGSISSAGLNSLGIMRNQHSCSEDGVNISRCYLFYYFACVCVRIGWGGCLRLIVLFQHSFSISINKPSE